MIAAERAGERGDLTRFRRWTAATLLLGAAFLGNQIAEYATLDFGASDHTYGSIYWLLTGLHTCHVAAGLLALAAADRPLEPRRASATTSPPGSQARRPSGT